MSKQKKYLLSVIILFCFGCTPIYKAILGIKKPKVENAKTLTAFLIKQNCNANYNATIDSVNLKFFSKFFIPELFVFDNKGNLLNYKDTSNINCNAKADKFIENLESGINYPVLQTLTLKEFLEKTQTYDFKKININPNDYDFILIMSWVKFGGKNLFKNHNKLWLESASENKKVKTLTILLNLDYYENAK